MRTLTEKDLDTLELEESVAPQEFIAAIREARDMVRRVAARQDTEDGWCEGCTGVPREEHPSHNPEECVVAASEALMRKWDGEEK